MKDKRNEYFAGKKRIFGTRERRRCSARRVIVILQVYHLLLGIMLLVSSSLDQQLNEGKSKFILDQVALDQLPIIFPHTFNVSSGWSYGELLHASWPKNKKNKAQRLYGVGPTAKDPPEGQIVQGDWPDLLDRLTYIPILKNGHTSLSNAFGDLRQRLNGNVELLNQSPLNTTLPPRASMNRTLLEEQRQPCT
jgi:hypothetical protein